MPQISLYIDDKTLKQIENAAHKKHVSISKWVAEQIRTKVEPTYPLSFEKLFGSINDNTFIEPGEGSLNLDIKREKI